MQELQEIIETIFGKNQAKKITLDEMSNSNMKDTIEHLNINVTKIFNDKLEYLLDYDKIAYKINDKIVLPKSYLALKIIKDAKSAIQELESINKNNKK